MLYKFKSKAGADVIMLGPHGDALLRVLGREPAPRGIVEPDALAAAIGALEQHIAADEAARAQAEADAQAEGRTLPPRDEVTPRQRLWPLRDLLQRALQAEVPVVWGD